MNTSATEWWLVRHAPTVNPTNAVYGALDLDVELPSPEKFEALSRMLPSDPVWLISNLSRTRKTLDGILAARGDADAAVHVEPQFAEQNFGNWEGRSSKEVWAELRETETAWPADIRPPGGEKFSEVAERVHSAALAWSERFVGRQIVAVIHSGSIRAFLSAAIGNSPPNALCFSVETMSVTLCDHFEREKWRVRFVNRVV